MYFLVDNDKQIIFGWSAKCGCSHIKNIFWFLHLFSFKTPILIKQNIVYSIN